MKKKTVKTKELYFVIWPDNEYDHMAVDFDSYEEAKKSAEEFLQENDQVDGLYYIAKGVEKLYYSKVTEKL